MLRINIETTSEAFANSLSEITEFSLVPQTKMNLIIFNQFHFMNSFSVKNQFGKARVVLKLLCHRKQFKIQKVLIFLLGILQAFDG